MYMYDSCFIRVVVDRLISIVRVMVIIIIHYITSSTQCFCLNLHCAIKTWCFHEQPQSETVPIKGLIQHNIDPAVQREYS